MKTPRKSANTLFIQEGNIPQIEIHYRYKIKSSQLPKITGSGDVYSILTTIWDSNKIEYIEEFIVLLLNRNNKVLGWSKISSGGVSGTVVDPKVIFQLALKANASAIVLAHNHPSGNIQPSHSDKVLTKKIKDAGEILDIKLIDHLIITSEEYFSFADNQLI